MDPRAEDTWLLSQDIAHGAPKIVQLTWFHPLENDLTPKMKTAELAAINAKPEPREMGRMRRQLGIEVGVGGGGMGRWGFEPESAPWRLSGPVWCPEVEVATEQRHQRPDSGPPVAVRNLSPS